MFSPKGGHLFHRISRNSKFAPNRTYITGELNGLHVIISLQAHSTKLSYLNIPCVSYQLTCNYTGTPTYASRIGALKSE